MIQATGNLTYSTAQIILVFTTEVNMWLEWHFSLLKVWQLFLLLDRVTVTAACNMDFSRFPLDSQTCSLELESCEYMLHLKMTRSRVVNWGIQTVLNRKYHIKEKEYKHHFFPGTGIWNKWPLYYQEIGMQGPTVLILIGWQLCCPFFNLKIRHTL